MLIFRIHTAVARRQRKKQKVGMHVWCDLWKKSRLPIDVTRGFASGKALPIPVFFSSFLDLPKSCLDFCAILRQRDFGQW